MWPQPFEIHRKRRPTEEEELAKVRKDEPKLVEYRETYTFSLFQKVEVVSLAKVNQAAPLGGFPGESEVRCRRDADRYSVLQWATTTKHNPLIR